MREFTVAACQATLRYHDLPGEAVPILFIHGLGCAGSFDYPSVAACGGLAQHRRILVDLLGSGFSDKPAAFDYSIASHAATLAELVEHLQLSRLVVFGHSMGGAVAIVLARLLGDKLQALILSEANLDAGGGFFSRQIAQYSEDEFVAAGHAALVAQSRDSGNSQWAATLALSAPWAIHRSAVSLIAGQTPSWRQILYQLPMTKGFLFGRQSLPDADFTELPRHGVPVLTVADAGHSMAWENPAGVAAAIQQLLLAP